MKKHKNILIFLIKFFATYFILFAIYSVYLQNSQKKDSIFQVSSITKVVADQTISTLTFFGYNVEGIQHDKELSIKLIIEGEYTARVIEGCTSISIIILFIAFLVAFAGTLKATILFALFGSVFIYIINILRIAFLTVLIYKYPEHVEFLHGILFPAIIYGAIFFLWIIWVNKFSSLKK